MRTYLKASVLALSLLIAGVLVSPSAQVQIQRGFGPTVSAGSGGATAGISSVLTVSTTSASTPASLVETDLWTYTLPANTLSANNYGVKITVFGTTAANANNKIMRLYFDTFVVSAASGTTSAGTWILTATVTRTLAATQLAFGNSVFGTGSTVRLDRTTPNRDTSTAITIKLTGQNGTASAGDVVFEKAVVEFFRAGS